MSYKEIPVRDSWLSDKVYNVDPKKIIKVGDIRPKKGHYIHMVSQKYGNQEYYVVDANNKPISGFQAMVVAPKSENGAVDMKHITIAYAGTNVKSIGDVATDGTDVLGGVDATGQWNDAKKFADKIHTKYPNAKISVIGHSLGGFLALGIAALNHWPANTFSAPSPSQKLIGVDAFLWAQGKGKSEMINYRHFNDSIPFFGGLPLGTQVFSKQIESNKMSIFGHKLESFGFTKDGQVKTSKSTNITTQMKEFKLIKGQMTKDELANGGKIFLDIAQAAIMARALEQDADNLYKVSNTATKSAIQDLEDTWDNCKKTADQVAPHLSNDEIMNALADGGATKHSIVTALSEKYTKRLTQLKKLTDDFKDIAKKVSDYSTKMADKDKQVAGMFK